MFEKMAGYLFIIMFMLSISIVGVGYFMRQGIAFEKAQLKQYKELEDEQLKKDNEELSDYYTADER